MFFLFALRFRVWDSMFRVFWVVEVSAAVQCLKGFLWGSEVHAFLGSRVHGLGYGLREMSVQRLNP